MPDKSALGALSARAKKLVSRRDAALFTMSFLLILAVHYFAFTNKLINHDDLSELFSGGSLLASGRWLLNPVLKLMGRVSAPAVYGPAGSALLALTALTVIRVLRIRRTAAAAAVALCMAAHPTVVCTWAYMFTAPAYFFAMLLAALGAALIRRPGWRCFASGAALIGMSMGCYQAYLALAAALSVLALLVDVWDGRFDGTGPLLTACLRSLLGLLAGLLIYLAVLKVCLLATGTELLSYAGIDRMTGVSPAVLLKRALLSFRMFFRFPDSPAFSAVHRFFPGFLRAGLAAAALSALYFTLRRRLWREPGTLIVHTALLAAMPLAAELCYVMADRSAVHWLMLFPTALVWAVPAVAADRVELPEKGRAKRAAATAAAVALLAVTGLTGCEGALIANKAYLEMELTRQSANSYLTRLLTRVEEHEGYAPGAKVALIGRAGMDAGIPDEGLTGLFIGEELLNIYSRGSLLRFYHGASLGWVSPEEIRRIQDSDEFAGMPAYPAEGSVRTIYGVITVKLS